MRREVCERAALVAYTAAFVKKDSIIRLKGERQYGERRALLVPQTLDRLQF